MTFALTEKLIDSIICALENQEKKFLLNAEDNSHIEKTDDLIADEELLYALPKWESSDGFF